MPDRQDTAVRVMTDDHGFRVIVATTEDSVREIIARQGVAGAAAEALAGLVTGVALLRETMAPNLRVQGVIKGAGGRGTLVGDSFPDGMLRGLAQLKGERASFTLGEGSLLQMMRTLVNGSLQQGIVDVALAGGIGQAITSYFNESEQLVCMARVGSRFDGDELVRSAGFVVQLLPEAERPAHMIMTQRLEDLPPVESFLAREDFSVEVLLEELCHGMPYTLLERSSLRYGCRCDEGTLLSALATVGREEISSMIDEGKPLEIGCDYCNTQYVIEVERLRALIAES